MAGMDIKEVESYTMFITYYNGKPYWCVWAEPEEEEWLEFYATLEKTIKSRLTTGLDIKKPEIRNDGDNRYLVCIPYCYNDALIQEAIDDFLKTKPKI